jgi:hypothetical protein
MSHWFRSRRLLAAGVVVAAGTLGCSGSGSSGGDGASPDGEPVGWRVDSCVHQVDGPTTIPDDMPAEDQEVLLAQQVFEPTACSDRRAARITHLGEEVELGEARPVDDGCPADTDVAFVAEDPASGLDRQVVCARNLEPPHPGDPGGGGGDPVVGDCVYVLGSDAAGQLDDVVVEMPCDEPGWFATIVAQAPDPAGCPAEALSRLPSPGTVGEVSCLAPDGPEVTGGTMAAPGECVTLDFVRNDVLPTPAPCEALADGDVQRIEAFAEQPGSCPDGGESMPVTGYDRELCLG